MNFLQAKEEENAAKMRERQIAQELDLEKESAVRKAGRIKELEEKTHTLAARISEQAGKEEELTRRLAKALDECKENGTSFHDTTMAREAELHMKLETARKQLEDARHDLDKEQRLHSATQSELDNKAKSLAGLRLNEEFLKEELARLNEEHARTVHALQNTISEKTVYQKEVDELSVQARADQQMIDCYSKEIATIHKELDETRGRLQNASAYATENDEVRRELDSERLARRIAEANLSEVDKERTMLKEEVRQLVHRNDKDLIAKENAIAHLTEELNQAKRSLIDIDDIRERNGQTDSKINKIHELEAELQKVMKERQLADSMKKSAIAKLEQVMSLRVPEKPQKAGNDTARKLRIKEKEMMNAQQQISELKSKLKDAHDEKDRLVATFNEQIQTEESRANHLESKIKDLLEEREHRRDVDSRSIDSREGIPPSLMKGENVEGFVHVRLKGKKGSRKAAKIPWESMYCQLTPTAFILFAESKMGGLEAPQTYIEVTRLCYARLVTAADVRFAQPESLPKIFHIMYDGADGNSLANSRHSSMSDLNATLISQADSEGNVSMRSSSSAHRHDFQELSFHMTAYCDFCNKKLSDLIRPPPALECKNCRYKIHKEHLHNADFPLCKSKNGVMCELLLMAVDKQEAIGWVKALRETIDRNTHRRGVARNRTLPTSHSRQGSANH
ncbi:unnamed protein product, partial [Mesorhabditis spiculigera]